MKIITTINSSNINLFLESKADALMIGLNDYTTYLDKSFSYEEIKEIVNVKGNKEIYVLVNRIIEQDEIDALRSVLRSLLSLDIDGIVVMDMGILEIAKEEGFLDRIVFSPSTYLTNKDSAAYLASLGVKRLVLSKEISLNNIFEIKNNVTCDVEITTYGYRNIFYSKRHIKTLYKEMYGSNDFRYLKEEKRVQLFPIEESEHGTFVFSSKKLSLWAYFERLLANGIDYVNLESNFVGESIIDVIDVYSKAIELYGKEGFKEYLESIEFDDCDEGFINKDSVYMQEEY